MYCDELNKHTLLNLKVLLVFQLLELRILLLEILLLSIFHFAGINYDISATY